MSPEEYDATKKNFLQNRLFCMRLNEMVERVKTMQANTKKEEEEKTKVVDNMLGGINIDIRTRLNKTTQEQLDLIIADKK